MSATKVWISSLCMLCSFESIFPDTFLTDRYMRTIYIRTLAKRTLATGLLKFNQLGALSSAFVS